MWKRYTYATKMIKLMGLQILIIGSLGSKKNLMKNLFAIDDITVTCLKPRAQRKSVSQLKK